MNNSFDTDNRVCSDTATITELFWSYQDFLKFMENDDVDWFKRFYSTLMPLEQLVLRKKGFDKFL